ncbi:MAG: M17 family peptidase N-terminal domain-containing protein [Nitrospiria bacterium]
MKIEVQSLKAIHVVSDIMVLGFFDEKAPPRGLAGEVDWVLNNTLSLLIKTGKTTGRFGEVVLVSSGKTKTSKILWVGLGKKEEFNHPLILNFAPLLYHRLALLGVKEAYLDLWDIEGCPLDFSSALNAFLNGIFQDWEDPKGKEIEHQALPVRDPGIGGIGGRKAPHGLPNTIDLTFHSREKERIKEMNRFLKEFAFKSKMSSSAGGELLSRRK